MGRRMKSMLSEVKVSSRLMRCLCHFPEAFILKIRSVTAPGETRGSRLQPMKSSSSTPAFSSLAWPAFNHVISALEPDWLGKQTSCNLPRSDQRRDVDKSTRSAAPSSLCVCVCSRALLWLQVWRVQLRYEALRTTIFIYQICFML